MAIEMALPRLRGLHASARTADLEALERAYRDHDWRTMPLAHAASPPATDAV
jgi:hypothetical protein